MPLLPDLWDSALGGILDLVLVGCQLSVYIWLLLLAFAGHVLPQKQPKKIGGKGAFTITIVDVTLVYIS